MLLVGIGRCRKPVFRYRYQILNTCLGGQRFEYSWIFFDAKKGIRQQKRSGKGWLREMITASDNRVKQKHTGQTKWKLS